MRAAVSSAQRFPYLLQGVNTLASGIEGVLFVTKLVADLRTELKIRSLRSLRSRNETYHKMHSEESDIST